MSHGIVARYEHRRGHGNERKPLRRESEGRQCATMSLGACSSAPRWYIQSTESPHRSGFVGRSPATLEKQIPINKTLTYDQGKEMTQHQQFTLATGMKVFFAHPHSPWERGTNENTNGLIRQYFPKGTDFRKVTTQAIKKVQRSLNSRPRQSLGYYTPEEKFTELVALKG